MRGKKLQSSQVVKECAQPMLAPLIRILATVGLSQRDMNEICSAEFKKSLALARRRKGRRLKIVDRDPCYPDIVTHWATHPRYQDHGRPADLRPGGGAPSFSSLVREIKPSLQPRAVLTEWRRLKIVRVRKDGHIALRRRSVPTISGTQLDLRYIAATTSDFLRALEFNIVKGTQPDRGLFQRDALSYSVHRKSAAEFNRYARDQAMLLLEAVDDWLVRHQLNSSIRRRQPTRLGLGIYVINEAHR